MQVRRVGFVGTRTADVPAMEAFFRDVLGLASVRSDPNWSILNLPTGSFDFVEVYGPAFEDERLAPRGVGLFVAFVVDDLAGAHAEMRAAGRRPRGNRLGGAGIPATCVRGVRLVLRPRARWEPVLHRANPQ